LALNATNTGALIRAYGPNSDDWIGREVELYGGTVEYQGKEMDAIRVRPISPALKASEKTKPPPEAGMDDEIPF
jgi:hypothetical protein